MDKIFIRILVLIGLSSFFLFPFVVVETGIGASWGVRGLDITKKVFSKIRRDEAKEGMWDKLRSHAGLEEWSDVVKRVRASMPQVYQEEKSMKEHWKDLFVKIILWQIVFLPVFYFLALLALVVALIVTDQYSLWVSTALSFYAVVLIMVADVCLEHNVSFHGLLNTVSKGIGRIQLEAGLGFALMGLIAFIASTCRRVINWFDE